jgi:hypothetical protein
MKARLHRSSGPAALVVAVIALLVALSGVGAAVTIGGSKPKGKGGKAKAGKVVRLGKGGKLPAKVLPKVPRARRADRLGSQSAQDLTGKCAATTVDLGSWCLQASPYPVPTEDTGKNDYLYATKACVDEGGWLPTAAQLVGAAARVKLAGTITDSPLSASVDQDPTDGLKDRREMSATLITTQAGSSAAGSEGVSDGAKGDPKAGEPDPVPVPANPTPETLQYVTVFDNGDAGGFAGARPVGQPENFRCGFDKQQGTLSEDG